MQHPTLVQRFTPRLGSWLLAGALAAAGVLLQSVPAQAQNIDVDITADNAYGFGYGTTAMINTYQGNIQNCTAGEIFNCGNGPEAYTILPGQYAGQTHLYIVAWADKATSQGVLAQFKSGPNTIYSGQGNWEVCATGIDIDPQCGGAGQPPPALMSINQRIALCNAGGTAAGYSQGWVVQKPPGQGNKLVFGEDNTTPALPFPIACTTGPNGIDGAARWMWYDGTPNGVATPFTYVDNPRGDYLIFRLPINQVVPQCLVFADTKVECQTGPSGPSGCYTVTTTITNNTGATATHVMLASTAATPNVIPLVPPLPNGQSRLISFTLCPPANSTVAAIDISLAGPGGEPCCRRTLRFELPPCPQPECLWVPKYKTECIAGAPPGTFNLWFNYRNMTACPASLFLIANPPSTATASYFAGSFLPFTGTGPTYNIPVKVTGATSSVFCMIVSQQCKDGGNCCSRRVCFTVPNCWPNPMPTPTMDLTPLDGASGENGGQ